MRTFYIDPETNDLVIDAQHSLQMVEDAEEENQAVRLLMGTNKSEWFLNTLHGLAYKYLQVKNPNETVIKAEVISTLTQESRVEEVLEVTVDFDRQGRVMTVSFKARMESGETAEGQVTA